MCCMLLLNPDCTSPQVVVHGATLDAADVGTAHLTLPLSQRLLHLAIAGGHLGVTDQAGQQVHTVHSRVAGQRLGQLHHVLDLGKRRVSDIRHSAGQICCAPAYQQGLLQLRAESNSLP